MATKSFEVQISGEKKTLTLNSPTAGDTDEWLRFSIKKLKEIRAIQKAARQKLVADGDLKEGMDKKVEEELVSSESVDSVIEKNKELMTKRCEILLRLTREKVVTTEDYMVNIAQSDRATMLAWLDAEMGLTETPQEKNFTKT